MKKAYLFWLFLAVVLLAASFLYMRLSHESGKINVSALVPGRTSPERWYKNSIFYNLDVKVFKDGDGDGIGDFKGLLSKLDYIDSLGFNAIWLAPFQPSAQLDDGYDITAYKMIDKKLGTMADFQSFLIAAKRKHIKVIMDLVINHTSDEHPWFLNARNNAGSAYYDWYVWTKSPPGNTSDEVAFPEVENEIWTFDSAAKQYFYHRFYHFEPDLNTQNSEVVREIKSIMMFWTDNGIDGFRMDAVPFVIEIPNAKDKEFGQQYDLLTQLSGYLHSINPDALLLGEANVPPEDNDRYFGENGERMNMLFNFYSNQYLFYALATADLTAFKQALQRSMAVPATAQWGYFLRNHDEVDLGRLSNKQRSKVYEQFGPQKNMQLYNRGIRRRLAPMLNNDSKRLKMAYSLLLSLPGTPFIRYGEEIGMGDNLGLKERLSVRTPMQWSANTHAGFTSGLMPIREVIDTGTYAYQKINVESEKRDSASLLNWMHKMILLRKSCQEINSGSFAMVETRSDHTLAMTYSDGSKVLLVIHNFSALPQTIDLSRSAVNNNVLKEISGDGKWTAAGDRFIIKTEPFEYKWLRAG